jgi:ATP-dependent Lon protease
MVHKLIKVPDGTLRILVQGLQRIKLDTREQEEPYLVGTFSELPDVESDSKELEALVRNVQMLFGRIVGLVPYLPAELELAAANVDDASALSHLVASTMRLKTEEKQQLLEQTDVEQRLRELSLILSRELEVFELGTKIQSQVQSELEKGQREYFLRQQLKAIQQELGEGDPEQAELQELRERIAQAELPEEARKAVDRELGPVAAVVEDDRGQPRPRAGTADPGRGPLRPRQGQGPDHRVPRRRQAEERRLGLDPLLRRAARSGEDLAGAVDRADARS